MKSLISILDGLQIGVQGLTKDLKSRDMDEFTGLLNQLMKDMNKVASAFQHPDTKEHNAPNLFLEQRKLLELTEFDAKLAFSQMDREEAFKYPWMTTSNCEERFKTLELSIQYFADHVIDAGPSSRACIAPFTKLVVMFKGIVLEYIKLRHRRIVMQLDPAVKLKVDDPDTQHLYKEEVLSYVCRPFSMQFIADCLYRYYQKTLQREAISIKLTWDDNKGKWTAKREQWADALVPELESRAIQVIMIEPKKLLNSPCKANQLYDEERDRPSHPLLQWCKLDLTDREEGVLHWSLGGVVAWRFYGEDEWMDRFGHVIDEAEY
ncbi:hypothetical protein FPCIR_5939 [Fusarium pseudocircinatum]|uniref:Uncharacterized protein n=1 Tax=Fusarium pseudocircinatum TaxID=56676 RepID=A0A8H5UJS8_9HYPO|nr:hypothetical protein FPCIR_5939 [Fusarium pseudocircinatum]